MRQDITTGDKLYYAVEVQMSADKKVWANQSLQGAFLFGLEKKKEARDFASKLQKQLGGTPCKVKKVRVEITEID